MSDDSLRELGKQLPWHRPDDDRRESMRSSLLVAASEGAHPGARRRWLLVGGGFAAGALAAAAVAILVVGPGHDAAEAPRAVYAQIESSSAAELEHTRTPTATGTDELVRVRTGTVRLAVPAVRAGDHVRLQTANAEVEGSGSYEVVVAGDALTSVAVTAGTASVKVKGQTTVFLAAGQTWRAPVVTTELVSASAPRAGAPTAATRGAQHATSPSSASASAPRSGSPTPATAAPRVSAAGATATSGTPLQDRAATSPTPERVPAATAHEPADAATRTESPRGSRPVVTAMTEGDPPAVTRPNGQPSPTEQHFHAGWALLRAGKAAEAAVELGVAADTGDQPLASDARYFQAVALVKAGRGADAERALVGFLDHAPTSVRRGRAAVMLGRLLVDRGDRKAARAWFETATSDADPAIAAAARAGIASLAH